LRSMLQSEEPVYLDFRAAFGKAREITQP